MKTNPELRSEGMLALKGNWGNAIIVTLIYIAISVAISGVSYAIPPTIGPFASNVASILIGMPLGYGVYLWFLRMFRKENSETDMMPTVFAGFSDYGRVLGTGLLQFVYTLLWTLLFIIPGIIKSLSYSMTFYIMMDDPNIGFNEAIEKSMSITKGYKMKLFLMFLNFMLWTILSMFTLGIGLLWVIPYMYSTMAAFYEDIKYNTGE